MRAARAVLATLEESLELRLKSSVKTVGIKRGIRDNQIEDRTGIDIGQHGIPAHEIRRRLNDEGLSGHARERDSDLSVGKSLWRRELRAWTIVDGGQNQIGAAERRFQEEAASQVQAGNVVEGPGVRGIFDDLEVSPPLGRNPFTSEMLSAPFNVALPVTMSWS